MQGHCCRLETRKELLFSPRGSDCRGQKQGGGGARSSHPLHSAKRTSSQRRKSQAKPDGGVRRLPRAKKLLAQGAGPGEGVGGTDWSGSEQGSEPAWRAERAPL